ncbi:MAG: hypothetical protein ACRDH5_08145 [bacterium]
MQVTADLPGFWARGPPSARTWPAAIPSTRGRSTRAPEADPPLLSAPNSSDRAS